GEPNPEARDKLEGDLGISTTADNGEAAKNAGVIFLGVKPGTVLPVLRDLASFIENKHVISFAAGIRLAAMETAAGGRFMRALTNTPSAICAAATGFARGSRTTAQDVELVRSLFGSIGLAVEVSEEQIDAVTALAGSGPAFVYTVIK